MGGGHRIPGVFDAPVKGHVNYLLSPNRQRYFVGFVSGIPARWGKKLANNWAWIPGIFGGFALYKWANWKEADIKRQHRM